MVTAVTTPIAPSTSRMHPQRLIRGLNSWHQSSATGTLAMEAMLDSLTERFHVVAIGDFYDLEDHKGLALPLRLMSNRVV
ncbi:hypothetical protein MRX96_047666 [Rhipicephalus microplus]